MFKKALLPSVARKEVGFDRWPFAKRPQKLSRIGSSILGTIALTFAAVLSADADNNSVGKIVVYYSAYNLGINPVEKIYLVRAEGQQGVALQANRYCEFSVAPGRRTLIRHGSLGSQDTIEVSVKDGETVYVECHHVAMGFWSFEVSEDQAHAKLRVSRLKPQN